MTAVVVPAAGAIIDAAALIAFCRARLAGYQTPKRIVTMTELPTTVGGKIMKYRIREMLRG